MTLQLHDQNWERENSNSKTLILKESSVRSIWTYLTASQRERERERLTHGLLWRPPAHTQGGNWGVGGGGEGERILHFSTIFDDLMDDVHCSAYIYHFTLHSHEHTIRHIRTFVHFLNGFPNQKCQFLADFVFCVLLFWWCPKIYCYFICYQKVAGELWFYILFSFQIFLRERTRTRKL